MHKLGIVRPEITDPDSLLSKIDFEKEKALG
jgi:hypothetical protein